MVVRQNEVEILLFQRFFELLPVAGHRQIGLQALLFQHGKHQIREIRFIFQMQDAQPLVHEMAILA